MNDILRNQSLQEFLQKRYEEIIANDKTHKDYNAKLIKLDNLLKGSISPEAYKIFMEYESISIQQETNFFNKIIFQIGF